MKQEFKDWFLNSLNRAQTLISSDDRRYSFINFHKKEIPFHQELENHIFSLHPFSNTYFDIYHLHIWGKGDYFDEHRDSIFGRKWAYVCELKSSYCNTSLIVNGKELKEGVFDSSTYHYLPPIKLGTRISLTVFGLPIKTLL